MPGIPVALISWSDSSTNHTLKLVKTDTVWVQITNGNCTIKDTSRVYFNPFKDGFKLGNDTSICAGDSLYLKSAYPQYQNVWSTGETTSAIYIKKKGEYSLIVRQKNCSISDSICNLNFNPLPIVNLGPDQEICGYKTIILDAGKGFSSYLWNTGVNESENICSTNSGIYKVTVFNNNNCKGEDSASI